MMHSQTNNTLRLRPWLRHLMPLGALLSLIGCAELDAKLDVTTPGLSESETAVLYCDREVRACGVSLRELESGSWVVGENQDLIYFAEIKLNPGSYAGYAISCSYWKFLSPPNSYESFSFEALAGQRYEFVKYWSGTGGEGCSGQVRFLDKFGADQAQRQLEKRLEELRQRAEKGDANAQYTLGWSNRELMEGRKWLCLAASQGHSRSANGLASIYRYGWGSAEQDYVEAYRWYAVATDLGDLGDLDHTSAPRHWMSDQMTPEEIAEGERRAREWRPGDCEGVEGAGG